MPSSPPTQETLHRTEPNTPLRVLIVEDHADVAANIGDYLAAHGHTPDFAVSGERALRLVLSIEFDVIVLDIMLPGMDGLTFCQKLREEAGLSTPVLMVSARDTVPDKIAGFRAGTDDYMTKPFSLDELACRVVALAKRAHGHGGQRLQVGDLELDVTSRRVRRAGRDISLSRASLTILTELMRASPNVVTKRRLETALWADEPPASDSLRSQIYILRRAIDRPFARPLLETVHGTGYRLSAEDG